MKKHKAPSDKLVQELVQLFSTRQYAQLERRAGQVLATFPDFPFAWKALSVAQMLTGRDALAAAQRAVELLPGDVEAHNNYAKALLDADRAEPAKHACMAALRIDPKHALTYNNLGNAQRRLGDFAGARSAYERALALLPGFSDAAFNLGNLLCDSGDIDAAEAALRHAITVNPGFVNGHCALARLLARNGRSDAALMAYQEAAARAPGRADILDEMAAMSSLGGQHAIAREFAERALAIDPRHASAHNNRGVALLGEGRLIEARAAFEAAIAIEPKRAEFRMNLGNVLRELMLVDQAVAAYCDAIKIDPENPDLNTNLLLAANYLEDPSALPVGPALACQNARATASDHWPNTPSPERRLRLGFVSPDLRFHPVGRFLLGPLPALSQHDLDLFVYYNHRVEDSVTAALRGSATTWRSIVGWSDEAVSAAVRADKVDILVDLAGHTGGHRLNVFARKPAPVQVAWFGYFASTGLRAIDYIVADPTVLPPGEADQFVEKPWRLPDTYYCFTPPATAVEVGGLPADRRGTITFGCFNNALKLNAACLDCWARILHRIDGATLFLKSHQYANPEVRQMIVERFAKFGIANHRLRFEGSDEHEDYLHACNEIDIALDPFPFTGGATTAEALWMGVPVLTLHGRRFISHQGETILNAVGLTDWIAADVADYVERAVRFANDRTGLCDLRRHLRKRVLASAFCDSEKFASNLANAFRGMWQEWCSQQGDMRGATKELEKPP